MAAWLADFLSRQNLLPTAHVISQMLPGHLHLLLSLLLVILYSPCCSCPVERNTSKPYGVILSGHPMSFLSSPLPGTLILIACFFTVAFFSNLKGPEPFLGLCDRRRRPHLKAWGGAPGSTGVDDVSDVTPGHAGQACDVAPLPVQSTRIFCVKCVLLEQEEKEICKQSSQRPVKSSLINNHWFCSQALHSFCISHLT